MGNVRTCSVSMDLFIVGIMGESSAADVDVDGDGDAKRICRDGDAGGNRLGERGEGDGESRRVSAGSVSDSEIRWISGEDFRVCRGGRTNGDESISSS